MMGPSMTGPSMTGPTWCYGHFDATVHQCSGCGYSSTVKVHVQNHLAKKCPSGKMINQKCMLKLHPLGTPADGSAVLATDHKTTMSVAVQTTVCTCGWWKADKQESREEEDTHEEETHKQTHEQETDSDHDRAYLYLVRNGASGDGVGKIGRWTRSLTKLLARYRTYYLHPRIWAVQVPAAAVNDLEKVLKDVAAYRDLNADKKRKRELVLDCEAMEEAFVTVAAHGDRRKIVVLEC